ncbi:MAG: GTP 3',8-cyclase MoaA [Deltaproteobacteria bacterium]|nr:GTP 3',8-cyclase MoaA [Deltaproteobacteria bacterium]
MLCDGYRRKIEYLRLSVTDLCNLRCRYCMPLEGAVKRERSDILSFEEIARVVAAFARQGVKGVRLTGGEPLLRKDLPRLIEMLHAVPGIEELSLTTNGVQLAAQAEALRRAGLDRVNVHLDTLDPEKFRQITRWGRLEEVLAGLRAAKEAGFSPLKLNAVLIKGWNDSEAEAMLRFAAQEGLILRWIELMPIGPGLEMSDRFLPSSWVRERLEKQYRLLPYGKRLGRGPAEYYKVFELNAVVGFIHAVSEPFCEKCNRVRLSADGRLQDCLAYDESESLLDLLRRPGVREADLEAKILRMIQIKRPDHGGFRRPACNATAGMYGIGG